MIKRLEVSQDVFSVNQIQTAFSVRCSTKMTRSPEGNDIKNKCGHHGRKELPVQIALPGFLQYHIHTNCHRRNDDCHQSLAQRSQRNDSEKDDIIPKDSFVPFDEI